MEGIETARACAKHADDKKAESIVILDVRDISPITDFFVICTATSAPHLRAVRDEIAERMREEHGLRPTFTDGNFESQWLILDYSDVMVHVMQAEKREFYALEDLWGDAPRIDPASDAPPPKAKAKPRSRKAKKP